MYRGKYGIDYTEQFIRASLELWHAYESPLPTNLLAGKVGSTIRKCEVAASGSRCWSRQWQPPHPSHFSIPEPVPWQCQCVGMLLAWPGCSPSKSQTALFTKAPDCLSKWRSRQSGPQHFSKHTAAQALRCSCKDAGSAAAALQLLLEQAASEVLEYRGVFHKGKCANLVAAKLFFLPAARLPTTPHLP